jgi:hypothetical protein
MVDAPFGHDVVKIPLPLNHSKRMFHNGLAAAVKAWILLQADFVRINKVHVLRAFYQAALFVGGTTRKKRTTQTGLCFVMLYSVHGLAAGLVAAISICGSFFPRRTGVFIGFFAALKMVNIKNVVGGM